MHKVLVLGTIRPEGLAILCDFAEITQLSEPVSEADLIARIVDVDAVLHKVGRIDADAMAAQTRLQIIARHGVGLDDLDLNAIGAKGIPVSITADANTNAVVEATLALALAALRHVTRAQAMLKDERRWKREELMGRELRGLTVGIVGYGRIGRRVAALFSAFGCSIVVHDGDPRVASACEHPFLARDDLFAQADLISLHCPLVPQTRHMLDGPALARMKPYVVIVNTARGGLIDTAALVAATRENRVGAAALDVFDREPPDFDDALFREPRILTTPHVAAMTIEAQTAMATGAAGEIRRVLVEGQPPLINVLASQS